MHASITASYEDRGILCTFNGLIREIEIDGVKVPQEFAAQIIGVDSVRISHRVCLSAVSSIIL